MKYNKYRPIRMAKQAGFTLIEIILALTIIVGITALITLNIDTNATKGKELFVTMSEVGKALKLMKLDTACYPTKLSALADKTQADQSFCGIDLQTNWKSQYLQRSDFDAATGNLKLTTIVPGSTLTILVQPSPTGQAWVLRATGIPNGVIDEALKACNGSKTANGTCTGAPGTGNGTFDLIFDENT